MNGNLVSIVQRVIADHGEAILSDPKRMAAVFRDYARNEPKEACTAFGCCVEMGAYMELKGARSVGERRRKKGIFANRMSAKTGIARTECVEALNVLESAISARACGREAPRARGAAPKKSEKIWYAAVLIFLLVFPPVARGVFAWVTWKVPPPVAKMAVVEGRIVSREIGLSLPIPAGWQRHGHDDGKVVIVTLDDGGEALIWLMVSGVELGAEGNPKNALPTGPTGGVQWRHVDREACRFADLECVKVVYTYSDPDNRSVRVETKAVKAGPYGVLMRCGGPEYAFTNALRQCDAVLAGIAFTGGGKGE